MYLAPAFLIAIFLLSSCSKSEYLNIARGIANNNAKDVAIELAIKKGELYAKNPQAAIKDIDSIKNSFDTILRDFIFTISEIWGEDNSKVATNDVYVKYTNNFQSRAIVDFDKGEVKVESIAQDNKIEILKEAIITTLLTPENPSSIDLYSSKDIEIKGKPYLAGLILDHQNKVVLYRWRATQFANYLIDNKLQKDRVKIDGKTKDSVFVKFDMIKDHKNASATKYLPIIKKYSQKYGLKSSLVTAIIEVESSFNPFATSHIPAYGLMQIVPSSAGRDVYREINKRDGMPTKNELFDSETNIKYGAIYLNILKTRYLKDIKSEKSREFCVISAYNTGSSNVFRAFANSKATALNIINSKAPNDVYRHLINKLPYQETRRYLDKVTKAEVKFIRY